MRRISAAITLFVLAFGLALPAIGTGNGQETCPEGDGWIKVDGLSGLTYTYIPPEDLEVTDNCMKVGSHDPIYGSGPTVTNTSLFNSPGGVTCTAPGVPKNGCALQDISHASFRLIKVVTPTTQPEPPTTTIIEDEVSSTVITPPTTINIPPAPNPSIVVPPADPVEPGPELTELPFTGIADWLLPAAFVAILSGLLCLLIEWRSKRSLDIKGHLEE